MDVDRVRNAVCCCYWRTFLVCTCSKNVSSCSRTFYLKGAFENNTHKYTCDTCCDTRCRVGVAHPVPFKRDDRGMHDRITPVAGKECDAKAVLLTPCMPIPVRLLSVCEHILTRLSVSVCCVRLFSDVYQPEQPDCAARTLQRRSDREPRMFALHEWLPHTQTKPAV